MARRRYTLPKTQFRELIILFKLSLGKVFKQEEDAQWKELLHENNPIHIDNVRRFAQHEHTHGNSQAGRPCNSSEKLPVRDVLARSFLLRRRSWIGGAMKSKWYFPSIQEECWRCAMFSSAQAKCTTRTLKREKKDIEARDVSTQIKKGEDREHQKLAVRVGM